MTIFLFLFGLTIFLFAMHELEAGLRLSSGEGLKNWLVRRTNTPLSSAGSGVIATAILQSSSMLSLLVLAFVSSGVIPLYNGIGVMLGANVGTTMTGWVVTVVGFKLNLQAMVVPLLGLGALCRLDYIKSPQINGVGRAIFAFGLLVFGLDIMKDSVASLSDIYDLRSLQDMPSWVYLLSGLFLAAVMQSSSAVMIVALSMLSTNMLDLSDAAAVVIGADLGTTSTTILGSLGESMIKKQLALAHVLFNVLVDAVAFLILLPMLPAALAVLSINDPLFGLVAFHSAFNLLGLIVFLPFLKSYTHVIQRLMPLNHDARVEYFLVPAQVSDVALDSLTMALNHMRSDALHLHLNELKIAPADVGFSPPLDPLRGSFDDQYQALKAFEGNFVRYAGQLQASSLDQHQSHTLTGLIASARALVYASKTLKDVRADYAMMVHAKNKALGAALHSAHVRFLLHLYTQLNSLFFKPHDTEYIVQMVAQINQHNDEHFEQANDVVIKYLADSSEASIQVATWFNLNKELHHYARYMLTSLSEMHRASE